MIELTHNFEPERFMWLWSKYVTGFNEECHCTHAITGRYSKRLSKNNPGLSSGSPIVLDEQPEGTYRAIYVCGVVKKGYAAKKNYPHNVHAAILPVPGNIDSWEFEHWKMSVKNGRFLQIPRSVEQLPARFQAEPDAFTSCRIFRWAACRFSGANGSGGS